MTLLFFSAVCDACERGDQIAQDRGYVVYRGAIDGEVYAEHVFRERDSARHWRSLQDLNHIPIFPVHSYEPFEWHTVTTADGLVTAGRRYLIYPDQNFPRGPHRAYVIRRK